MRNWINLFEVRKTDGVWKNPTGRDLAALVKDRDMRGVAVGDDVWLDYASEDVHFGLRSRLGLPSMSYVAGGEHEDGFDFYVCAPEVIDSYDRDPNWQDEDFKNNDSGRTDWVNVSRFPDFTVTGAAIFVSVEDDEDPLSNRAFARLVGRPILSRLQKKI